LYIHDVLGSLREKNLQLKAEIDVLRLDLHILERKVAFLLGQTDVSRETLREVTGDGDATLF